MFIGREAELKRLERMHGSGRFEFAVVYGRRRVGKTTLINRFADGKKCIFLACQKSSIEDNLIFIFFAILLLGIIVWLFFNFYFGFFCFLLNFFAR